MRLGQSKKTALHRDLNCMRSIARAQLTDHILHVGLYSFFGDREMVANDLVGVPLGNEIQYLDLPFGQIVALKPLRETVRNGGRDAPETLMDISYGSDEISAQRTLQKVTDRTCGYSARCPYISRVGSQDNDPCFWKFRANSFDGFDPAHARHLEVHESHIGTQLPELFQGLLTA